MIYCKLQELQANNIWNASVLPVQEEDTNFDRTHEYGLGPKWAEDFLECNTNAVQDDTNKSSEAKEDPNFSKFMKFMEREGDIPIGSTQTAMNLNGTSGEWVEQFIDNDTTSLVNDDDTVLNKVEEELEAAGTWIEEFSKENPITGNIFNFF